MERLFTILFCLCFFNGIQAQQDTVKTKVKNDTTRITLGKREIRIIESDNGTDIKVLKKNDSVVVPKSDEDKDKSFPFDGNFFDNDSKKHHNTRFRGHWNSIEYGYNGFLNSDQETSLTGADAFMSLNSNPTRSTNFNIHFCQVTQRLAGNSLGFVTGLGFDFYNYFFDNNNSIIKGADGRIVCDSLTGLNVDKSKLATTFFTIPLVFEFHFPAGDNKNKYLWMQVGVTGSIKLGSHTKVVYHEDGKKQKDKNRDDFNINALRYAFTARAGYSNFFVYGNYSPVSFFEKNKGPELYPFSVGIGFHFH
jgi:opacity protein-like surface antigen